MSLGKTIQILKQTSYIDDATEFALEMPQQPKSCMPDCQTLFRSPILAQCRPDCASNWSCFSAQSHQTLTKTKINLADILYPIWDLSWTEIKLNSV